MYCRNCGTFLNEGARFCPNCGQPQGAQVPTTPQRTNQQHQPAQQQYQQMPVKDKNGFGIAGFVFAILGIFLGGTLWSILGFIFSLVGIVKRRKYARRNKLAVAGLVISIIVFVIWLVAIIMEDTILGLFGIAL